MWSVLTPKEVSLAVDLGTRNILISNQQRVVWRQQTVAALPADDNPTKNGLIVGDRAEQIFEKQSSQFQIIRPLSKGVICDFENCKLLLSAALKQITRTFLGKPGILVSCPLDVTNIERGAFKKVFSDLGFHRVELIAEPTAAMAGLVSDFHRKKGILIVDVGAGITEAVVFSLGGIVCNSSIRIGGEDFEHAITYYIKKRFDFEIGVSSAHFLLTLIGQDHPDSYLNSIELKGVSIQSRSPGVLRVEMREIVSALDNYFRFISSTVRSVLEKTPKELSSDIIEQGIFLTGGASQFKGLVEVLQKETGLKVNIDSQPLLGVARGEIAMLQNPQLRKQFANG